MIKMVAPSMAYRVIDRAVQVSTDCGPRALCTAHNTCRAPSPSAAPPPVNSQQSPVVTHSPCMNFSFFASGQPCKVGHIRTPNHNMRKQRHRRVKRLGQGYWAWRELISHLWELGPCYTRAFLLTRRDVSFPNLHTWPQHRAFPVAEVIYQGGGGRGGL